MNKYTRFRAYCLGGSGVSYSYAVDDNFTLVGARYNEANRFNIKSEMSIMGCRSITKLHISSWDKEYCNPKELERLLSELKPLSIEMPGYNPNPRMKSAIESRKIIEKYVDETSYCVAREYKPAYVNGLKPTNNKRYTDLVYNPMEIKKNPNENSIVKLFRRGRFTVLNLGNCESANIFQRLERSKIVLAEVDILVVAKHCVENGFISSSIVDVIKPQMIVSYSDDDGYYKNNNRNFENYLGDSLYTVEDSDIVVSCKEDNICAIFEINSKKSMTSERNDFFPKFRIL